MHSLSRRLSTEALGTAFLLAGVVGSGIMAQRLAGGNGAIALLANTIATGAVLMCLIAALGPISESGNSLHRGTEAADTPNAGAVAAMAKDGIARSKRPATRPRA